LLLDQHKSLAAEVPRSGLNARSFRRNYRGRGAGVGRPLGVGAILGVGVARGVGDGVGVVVAVALGVIVGVAVGAGVGVGGAPDCVQYLPPVLNKRTWM
jgi:hypothetical protein